MPEGNEPPEAPEAELQSEVRLVHMRCPYCDWRWVPRKNRPKICPNPECHRVQVYKSTGNGTVAHKTPAILLMGVLALLIMSTVHAASTFPASGGTKGEVQSVWQESNATKNHTALRWEYGPGFCSGTPIILNWSQTIANVVYYNVGTWQELLNVSSPGFPSVTHILRQNQSNTSWNPPETWYQMTDLWPPTAINATNATNFTFGYALPAIYGHIINATFVLYWNNGPLTGANNAWFIGENMTYVLAPCLATRLNLSSVTVTQGTTVVATATHTGGVGNISSAWFLNGVRYPACSLTGSQCNITTYPVGKNNVTVRQWDAANGWQNRTAFFNASSSSNPLEGNVTVAPTVTDISHRVNATALVTGGSPPYSYAWSVDGSPQANTTAWLDTSFSTVGTHEITVNVTDSAKHHATLGTNVTVHSLPSVTLTSDYNNIVPGYTVNLTANATGGTLPYVYAWSVNGTPYADALPYLTYTPSGSGNYTFRVNVTDSIPATTSTSYILQVLSSYTRPSINITGNTVAEIGANDTLSTTIIGGEAPFTIVWSVSPSTAGSVTDGRFLPAIAGNITVSATVTDGKGNSSTATYLIVVHQRIGATVRTYSRELPVGQSELLTANVTGGVPPYTYQWSSGNNSATYNFSEAATGNYTITETVSDIYLHAIVSYSVNVVTASQYVPPHLTVPAGMGIDAGQTRPIRYNITQGTAPYTVVWSQVHGVALSLAGGKWVATASSNITTVVTVTIPVHVVDRFGYSSNIAAINLTLYPALAIYVSLTNADATVSITGGVAPYVIQWDVNGTYYHGSTVSLVPGKWSVSVTDANNRTVRANGTYLMPPHLPGTFAGSLNIYEEVGMAAMVLLAALFFMARRWGIGVGRTVPKSDPPSTDALNPSSGNIDVPPLAPLSSPPPSLVAHHEEWDEDSIPATVDAANEPGHSAPIATVGREESVDTYNILNAVASTPKVIDQLKALDMFGGKAIDTYMVELVSKGCLDRIENPGQPDMYEITATGMALLSQLKSKNHPSSREIPRTDNDPFHGQITPQEVNPNARHVDPELYKPASFVVLSDAPQKRDTTHSKSIEDQRMKELMEKAKKAKAGRT